MSGERMEIPDGQAREAWRASLSLKRHDGVMKGPEKGEKEERTEAEAGEEGEGQRGMPWNRSGESRIRL